MTDQQKYQQTLDWLFSQLPMFQRIGAAAYKPGLDTSIALDNHFGNPHRKYATIHVGGTNGKGSTSHMLAGMLQQAGYRTGLYTSPHLVDFRERIRVDGEMIPKEEVCRFVDAWRATDYDGQPSFFELTMAMAFKWFADCNVDVAVIEVGMGGRLDSTNIITPALSVITNISYDHMQFLGDTLEKIAAEKAGIMKRDVPIVIGEAEGGVRKVFEEHAAEVGAPMISAEDEALLQDYRPDPQGGWICGSPIVEGEFYAQLAGDYQVKNINTVLSAVKELRSLGFRLPDEAVKAGFAHVSELTGLAGRWMTIDTAPTVVCDTGHNIGGLSYTMPQLQKLAAGHGGKTRLVIGFVSDKDVQAIMHLLPRDAVYYATRASVPRAMPAETLHDMLLAEGLDSHLVPEGVAEAYRLARRQSSPDDIIYVGGSTFIVADLLADIKK